jgi:hypothetical protein
MKQLRAIWLSLVAVAVAGCLAVTAGPASPSTTDPCAASATAYGGSVAGSFVTTVGAVRAMPALHIGADRWAGLAADHEAVLCYVDGQIPMDVPSQAPGTVPPSLERAVIVVIDNQPELLVSGNSADIPVLAP